MEGMRVIYNDSCPICSREVELYRKEAESEELPITFSGLSLPELEGTGLSEDEAARRFHVVQNGRQVAGLDAFFLLWRALPRWRWLASLLDRPVIRPLARLGYNQVAAPVLYAMHRRRTRKARYRTP